MAQCRMLGVTEKLGDIVGAVEAVNNREGEVKRMVDWRQAYKDLHKLTGRIKGLLIQYGKACSAVYSKLIRYQNQCTSCILCPIYQEAHDREVGSSVLRNGLLE